MSSRTNTNTGSKKTGGFVRRNPSLVLVLPPPSAEPWAWFDLPERWDTPDPFPEGYLDKRMVLQDNSVIREATAEPDLDEEEDWREKRRTRWSVDERAWNAAVMHRKREIQADSTFPCGHSSGFVTLDADAGVYECGYEFCSETFDRETVERVMG